MKSELQKVNEKNVEAFRDFRDVIKHAARELLWLPEAKSLREKKGRFLKYFTLPGKWALDIFFFERNNIIEGRERGFPNVRFCDNNSYSYATAKRLLKNTIGKRGNFEDLVLHHQKEFWDGFPYDIYNLDFCGTCFPDKQPPFSRTFEAITTIIEKHVLKSHFPFILFLTMKALSSETNNQAQAQLKANIEINRANPEFSDKINEVIPDTERFVRRNFTDFIIISIPKIICHFAEAHCNVEIRKRAKYPRNRGAYFITKFVFYFSKRRRKSLSIRNPQYINNVRQIIGLDEVVVIDKQLINEDISKAHKTLTEYVDSLNKGRL